MEKAGDIVIDETTVTPCSAALLKDGDVPLKEALSGPYSKETLKTYRNIASCRLSRRVFEETIGRPAPEEPPRVPMTMESPLCDCAHTAPGRIVLKIFMGVFDRQLKKIRKMPDGPDKDEQIRNTVFIKKMMLSSSPRSLCQNSGGMVGMNTARAIVEFTNGHPAKALACLSRTIMFVKKN